MSKAPRLVLALLGALLISGCAARSVHVAQLKDQPARYYNKTVSVNGVVTRSWGVPLVPFQFYSVDDGTGQITVIGHSGRVPSTGTRVNVKGRVNEVASFGGQSLGLHLDETKPQDQILEIPNPRAKLQVPSKIWDLELGTWNLGLMR